MKYIADLHLHSKFSIATAKNLDLENLYIAAQLKGIRVVATGDFTHPGWFAQLQEKLVPAEAGLFKLKDDIAENCDEEVPAACRAAVRFILQTEISNVYKKDGRTRKNHNLVFSPNLEVAARFAARLDKIGNIKSDGRPILGLDARDLLEILLETSDEAFLIPAHIWTPWFSVLGSKSGFDSIEQCFGDLADRIFAVETGLSSDPPMNWRVSDLDRLNLVSNSDAHSPMNLGREANLFDTDLSYPAIKAALASGDPARFLGTLEFYPQEGKYHLDGHRNCGVCLPPGKTRAHGGLCPVCGKPLTLGVLYRVEELADRQDGRQPEKTLPFHSLIPLADILAEIFQVGPKTKKVRAAFQKVLTRLGPELSVLHQLELTALEQAAVPLLAEAVARVRQKKIKLIPGYDGQYGRVKIFSSGERQQLLGQKTLFAVPPVAVAEKTAASAPIPTAKNGFGKPGRRSPGAGSALTKEVVQQDIIKHLNERQRRAVEHPARFLLIAAGPGTGKTRTLTCRIAHRVLEKAVRASNILAVTFTNKAARQMQDQLKPMLGAKNSLPTVATFHGFCYQILHALKPDEPLGVVDDDQRKKILAAAVKAVQQSGRKVPGPSGRFLQPIIAAKQQILTPEALAATGSNSGVDETTVAVYRSYQHLLLLQGLYDFEDLIFEVVRRFEKERQLCRKYRNIFRHVFVDEYQDINHGQYRLIRALVPAGQSANSLCVIGDPDQSIYGFRGSDLLYFKRFVDDYPGCEVINLRRNYRSTATILSAADQVIRHHRVHTAGRGQGTYSRIDGVTTISILELANERLEAEAVARMIEKLVGGTGFHAVDTGRVADANLTRAYGYSDFGVLYRTHEQSRVLAQVFENAGIPFQIASRQSLASQPEVAALLCLLKLVAGYAGFADLETAAEFWLPAVGKKSMQCFIRGCLRNGFGLQKGMLQAGRFPVPGLKKSRQQALNDFSKRIVSLQAAAAGRAVADTLLFLLEESGLFSAPALKVHNSEGATRMIEEAKRFSTDTGAFLAAATLQTDTDLYEPRAEKVALMTMHAAKGLEFPVVFITGCEADFIPYRRPDQQPADVAEERRLFYVAVTRAMERLYLTRARKRRIYGQPQSRAPSPFLADIESRLKTDESPDLKKKIKDRPRQLELF